MRADISSGPVASEISSDHRMLSRFLLGFNRYSRLHIGLNGKVPADSYHVVPNFGFLSNFKGGSTKKKSLPNQPFGIRGFAWARLLVPVSAGYMFNVCGMENPRSRKNGNQTKLACGTDRTMW